MSNACREQHDAWFLRIVHIKIKIYVCARGRCIDLHKDFGWDFREPIFSGARIYMKCACRETPIWEGLKMVLLISVQNPSPFGRRPADPQKWAVRFSSDEGYQQNDIPRPKKISQPIFVRPPDDAQMGWDFVLI